MLKVVEEGIELESQGQFRDALIKYEMAIDLEGCPWDIRYYIGRVSNKMGEFEEALGCFDLVLEMDNKHIKSLFGKGISYIGLGQWPEAFNCFGDIVGNSNPNDANCYYYMAILGNYFINNGEFTDQINSKDISYFFDNFKSFDNDFFKENRSYYSFGLEFDYYKDKLYKSKKTLNVEGFKEELRLSGASDNQIDLYLKTLPYDNLLDEIKNLKGIQHEATVKQIIVSELKNNGFSDDDIKTAFDLESIDVLKNEVISLNNQVVFPDLDTSVNVPLYVKSPLGKFIFDNMTSEYDMIANLSQFNRFATILDSMHQDEFIYKFLKVNPNSINKKRYYYRGISQKKSVKHYNNFVRDINSHVKPKWNDIVKAYKACPKIFYNIVNIEFFIAIYLSKYGSFENKIDSFEYFTELIDNIDYYKNI